MRLFERQSLHRTNTQDADWTRTPAAIFASAVLGAAALGGLAWSWNRTIERDVIFGTEPLPDPILVLPDLSVDEVDGVAQAQSIPSMHQPMSAIKMIDLNTASVGELDLLPRIGPALAERIIADREENGAYETIDELKRVRGIGPKTIEKLRARVILSESIQASASDDQGG